MELVLGPESATTTTSIRFDSPREEVRLRVGFDVADVAGHGVRGHRVGDGYVSLEGVRAGATVTVQGETGYGAGVHGLTRWVDPEDSRTYVVGSGALGGSAWLFAGEDGPGDRMGTDLSIGANGLLRAARAPIPEPQVRGTLASHHVGFVAGPWAVVRADGVELLTRHSLGQEVLVSQVLEDTSSVMAWLTEWFGGERTPWGEIYTQTLLPNTPWLGMEHPGCVLLSERVLRLTPAQRISVLAHEMAHQWMGNLVSPLGWRDVGIFEGVAELLGQLACEDLIGGAAALNLRRHRACAALASTAARDLRDSAATAGLAEVAGPAQHADLLRVARADIGAAVFRHRLRAFVAAAQGMSTTTAELWRSLGIAPRAPSYRRLPHLRSQVAPAWLSALPDLAALDPASAAVAARRMFRACESGSARVRQALAVIADPRTPPAVVAGLGAELARRNNRRN